MALGVKVNLLGMVNMFEAAVRYRLVRLVFTSSETVYGASQNIYGDRPVIEDDYCSPADHFFTYGVMKILDEFMAQKYVAKHAASIVCTRPAVVFGHGRKRGSVLWAEDFATQPALGRVARLPFSRTSRDTWIYKDDCAEQLVRLALKPSLGHFAYNRRRERLEVVRQGPVSQNIRRNRQDRRPRVNGSAGRLDCESCDSSSISSTGVASRRAT